MQTFVNRSTTDCHAATIFRHRYYLKDRVAPHGFKLFGRSLASSAESATAVMTTVSGIASQISVIPGGTITARVGGRTVLALSFCVGAASLTAYAFTTDFSVVLVRRINGTCCTPSLSTTVSRVCCLVRSVRWLNRQLDVCTDTVKTLAAVNGLGGGLNAGAIGAISAATLPDVENSARDMNILVTGPVFGQMALQAAGGYVISWASRKWSPAVAWSVMWCVEEALRAGSILQFVRMSASHQALSLTTFRFMQPCVALVMEKKLRFAICARRLVSGGFFLLAVPTLIPIRPVQNPPRVQNNDEELKKAYPKAHDYRRGGLGGRY